MTSEQLAAATGLPLDRIERLKLDFNFIASALKIPSRNVAKLLELAPEIDGRAHVWLFRVQIYNMSLTDQLIKDTQPDDDVNAPPRDMEATGIQGVANEAVAMCAAYFRMDSDATASLQAAFNARKQVLRSNLTRNGGLRAVWNVLTNVNGIDYQLRVVVQKKAGNLRERVVLGANPEERRNLRTAKRIAPYNPFALD